MHGWDKTKGRLPLGKRPFVILFAFFLFPRITMYVLDTIVLNNPIGVDHDKGCRVFFIGENAHYSVFSGFKLYLLAELEQCCFLWHNFFTRSIIALYKKILPRPLNFVSVDNLVQNLGGVVRFPLRGTFEEG